MKLYPSRNLYIDQGVSFTTEINLGYQEDGFDVDDWSFTCSVAKNYSTSIILEGLVEVSETDSEKIILSFDADDTALIKPDKYQYDVIMTNDLTEEKRKIASGYIFILETITR